MASVHRKGATFVLLLLLLSFASAVDVDLRALIDRQEEQLIILRRLVDSLSDSVSRLESALSDASPARSLYISNPSMVDRENRVRKNGVVMKKSKPLWLDRFLLMAEARLEVEASCATVLPYVDVEGIGKYFAVGDVRGRLLVFSSTGDELIEFQMPSGSPVTAMLSYMSGRKNEIFLFTGHADGSLVATKIWENSTGNGDWIELAMGTTRVVFGGGEYGELGEVELLEVQQMGRVRYVVSSYGDGTIRVFTENGTLHGATSASSKPLALMKHRPFFLTKKGVGWLDLRKMVSIESRCEGLDGSLVERFAFDALERSKAYGFTQERHLIHVVLLGDATSSIKCRVRAIEKSGVGGRVSLLAIKGYLLAVNHERVFLFNVSSGESRPVFVATLADFKSLFPSSDYLEDGSALNKPLIAGNRGKLVVLGLGGRHIGVYRPNFPVVRVETNVVLWGSPASLFFVFLLGMWYFYGKRRGSMGWTLEESFVGSATAATAAAAGGGLLESGGSERPFSGAQRTGDLRDDLKHARRSPARWCTSPSSYPGGGTGIPNREGHSDSGFGGGTGIPNREGRADSGFGGGTGIPNREGRLHSGCGGGTGIPNRESRADSGFDGGTDFKYRGIQAVKPGAFPSKREPKFPKKQDLDDHID